MSKLFISAIVLFVATIFSGCLSDNKQLNSEASSSVNEVHVEVVKPQHRSYESYLEITGGLEANQEVKLHAMESGFIKSISKDIGSYVFVNEVIVELENPKLKEAYETANANHSLKKSIYERLKKIYDQTPDLTTIEEMEEAKAEYQSSKAILNTKKTSLDYLSVKAPFSGYITKRYVDKGALVQSALNDQGAQAIFELQDISKLRLVVDFPESDVELISKGQEVKVEFPELNSEPLIAHIDRLSNALDMSTKTMRVEIDIPNKTGLFKPGMYAKLRIALKDHGSLSVPLLAISGKKGNNHIYIVKDNIVSKMKVSLGLEDKEYIEVLNNDLNENDLVIIKGKEMVSEGLIVQTKLN